MVEQYTVLHKQHHKYKPLSRDEEARLCRLIKEGDIDARNKLVMHNINFAARVAKQYTGQGLDDEDIIQYAALGLIKAAEKFKEEKNFKFISYAVWWIRQSILIGLANDSRIVRIPSYMSNLVCDVREEMERIEKEDKRPATAKEIAQNLGAVESQVQCAMAINDEHFSLNATYGVGDETAIDALRAPDEDEFSDEERIVREAINKLPKENRQIVIEYYGLNNGVAGRTLQAIGNKMKLSKERIRQRLEIAKESLRFKIKEGYYHA